MTEKKRGRPATGETPIRGVRVPESLWKEAKAKAEEEDTTISEVVNTCLTKYVAKKPKK